jgi:hypothetical protein
MRRPDGPERVGAAVPSGSDGAGRRAPDVRPSLKWSFAANWRLLAILRLRAVPYNAWTEHTRHCGATRCPECLGPFGKTRTAFP